jgi:hypothetical protein
MHVVLGQTFTVSLGFSIDFSMLERLNTRRVVSMHPATSEYVCFISSA